MRIVITGGAGFLGRKLAAALLTRGALTDARGARRDIERITLVDVVGSPMEADPRVRSVAGDLADPKLVEAALEGGADTVFHLAAVVSGEAETNFDLGWRVNVDATRSLLERCRSLSAPPKFVFTSSCAVFGGPLPDPVPDDQALWPQSSYGNQKAIGEFLVYDFTRKGFIDGRSLRLPTISVRPGKPNKAASSFASGILREPLNGVEAICPVSRATRMWLLSPRAVIANMIVGHEAPASAFAHTRSINVPGISIPVVGMIDALRRVAGDAVADRVVWRNDAAIDRIVQTWPVNFDTRFGRSLGMAGDADFDSIIRQYVADELTPRGEGAAAVKPQ
jgi:nucleoside-diphosphate-sugar epimerase